MERPILNEAPLGEVISALMGGKRSVVVTMSIGQWDGFLQAAYDHGWNLLELDKNENPVQAYRKQMKT